MEEIYFYLRKEDYGWLSNFWRAVQRVEGMYYPTNEHYYQSIKPKSWLTAKWISEAPSPYQAMVAGRSLRHKEIRDDWSTFRVHTMNRGLTSKFIQNPGLLGKLIETGDARLHEDSPTDMFWGVKGKDMLGKLLMEVRERLNVSS